MTAEDHSEAGPAESPSRSESTERVRPRRTRYQGISADAQHLLSMGESSFVEFKRDDGAVRPSVLAALANTAALSPDGVAHLLVGVEENKDPLSGLVTGVPFGLPDLEKAVARLQDRARTTCPVPVDTFIVEEGVAGPTPFLRVEVRATMAPHYDQEGRRQVRHGCSTRALTDEEMLGIYLDREASSFADRFRHTSTELRSAVGGLEGQVEEISSAIEHRIARPLAELQDAVDGASSAASGAESAAQMTSFDVDNVERLVKALQEMVEDLRDESGDAVIADLMKERRTIWWNFTVDTWQRKSALADRIRARMRKLLEDDISIDSSRNAWEVQLWKEISSERRSADRTRGTLAWWDRVSARAKIYSKSPTYAGPDIPDIRAELLTDLDKALDDPGSQTSRFHRLISE